MDQRCRICEVALTDDDLVSGTGTTLWDGNAYCRKCVVAQSSVVFEIAQANEQYSESHAPRQRETFGETLRLLAILLAIVVLLSIVASKFLGIDSAGFFVAWCMATPVALAYILFASFTNSGCLPIKTTVGDGMLTVHAGDHLVEAELVDCYWYEGKAWHVFGRKALSKAAFRSAGPAIVIQYPGAFSQYSTTVGFTAETYEIWKAFFKLAGTPKPPPATWFGDAFKDS